MRLLALMLALAALATTAHAGPTLGVFDAFASEGLKRALAPVRKALADQGYQVKSVGPEELCSSTALTPTNYALLLWAPGKGYPADSMGPLDGYLKAGGRLIVLGGPAFSLPSWLSGGRWQPWSELLKQMSAALPDWNLLPEDGSDSAAPWGRGTSDLTVPGKLTVGTSDASHGRALTVTSGGFTSWDTWTRRLPTPRAGYNLLTLWAKGNAATPQASMELREKDGSRWIAVLNLSTDWGYHALSPKQFQYWQDNPSKGRGGAGDQVSFDRIAEISVGLALSHTQIPSGSHEFSLDQLGLKRDPRAASSVAQEMTLDGLCPDYKLFPVRGAVKARSGSELLPVADYPLPTDFMSVSPRPLATGFGKGRWQRFIPLIEALDERGRRSGYLAWMHLNTAGAYAGSAWAAFGTDSPAFYESSSVSVALISLCRAMAERPLLTEGGAEKYAYLSDTKEVTLGCRVTVPPYATGALSIRIRVLPADPGKALLDQTTPVKLSERVGLKPLASTFSMRWSPSETLRKGGRCRVITELLSDGKVIDSLKHDLLFWAPKPTSERQYVSAKDGAFWLKGERWAPHGVNYMPSSGVALEDGEAFESWLGARGYDPGLIEQDLERVRDLGMNSISVFLYYKDVDAQNVLDLLDRADRLGIKVNLSLRPHADPLEFNWQEVRDMLTRLRLPESDVIYAYDLAWERGFGTYEPSYTNVRGRKFYDPQWRGWVTDQYGSIEGAERDWGFAIPRNAGGEATGPADSQLDTDGPWRRMVAAYRRFVEDFAARAYGQAARRIRTVDPNHLITFRMNSSGDPTASPREMLYDYRGLARALDIMEPEGYGRIGDWNRVRDGAFTAAWSRYSAKGRPILWSEFGQSAWAATNFLTHNAGLDFQGELYQSLYKMMQISGANGSAAWWYPGGFRVGERSDFGILNPDGTDRPSTTAIRQWMPRLASSTKGGPPPEGDALTIDRDADARGIQAVYLKVKDAFWSSLNQGKLPRLVDAGTGTTSANAPMTAVGNSPYTGSNPPKYLNAVFDSFQIRDASGQWVEVAGELVRSGEVSTVTVIPGRPVMARAIVGNTQQATWLAPPAEGSPVSGTVALYTTPESPTRMPKPVPIAEDVPDQGAADLGPFQLTAPLKADTEVVVRMTSLARMWFGEKVRVKLRLKSN
jgi:hypothetical protein